MPETMNVPTCVGTRVRLAVTSLAVCGLVTACGVTPPLGRGLPATVDEADQAFDARIHARFPVGRARGPLLEELQRERFKIDTTLKLHAPIGNGRPKTYIHCNQPDTVLDDSRALVKSLRGWNWIDFPGPHDGMITRPDAVAKLLLQI
jgi:hypothetical protein